uniref:Conserved oligomeric Golgi complex subunit 3 n=1 Tax=Cacopsylla melanoneura TaxID=428564 RepID=A0A8D8ZX47_9HEMI
MVDVAKTSSSANKLQDWEKTLAPLSKSQRTSLQELDDEQITARPFPSKFLKKDQVKEKDKEESSIVPEDINSKLDHIASLNSVAEFLTFYATLENDWMDQESYEFEAFRIELEKKQNECNSILNTVNSSLQKLEELKKEYNLVSGKTNTLHKVSEQLLLDQTRLNQLDTEISQHVKHFKDIDRINQLLDSAQLNVLGDMFGQLLNDIDVHLVYINAHKTYKDSGAYLVRYGHALNRIVTLVRAQVGDTLRSIALAPGTQHTIDAAIVSTNYNKFRLAAAKLRPIIANIETRTEKSPEYNNLLAECEIYYLQARRSIAPHWAASEIRAVSQERPEPSSLVKAGVCFLLQLCLDEYDLYGQFFSRVGEGFKGYLEELCTSLYDIVRPLVIHMQHLETLSELCTVLRHQVQEQIQMNPNACDVLQRVCQQLLQDTEERLVFRANMYLHSDILYYNPSPGDLAYPEKLEVMAKISESLAEPEERGLHRVGSHSSLVSEKSMTCEEVRSINRSAGKTAPVDLQGLWYPPVRRTLVCLSRLYRCVEKPIFQGISQEAVSMCIQSVASAADKISAAKSPIDGELFQIKHLLILREQIAPFQVDFTSKEVSLDFNKVKNAAYSLLQKRYKIFSLDSTNSILELLLDGIPFITENTLDSRKEVDRQLKASCEMLIRHATTLVVGSLQNFMDKTKTSEVRPGASIISVIVQETLRKIKEHLPGLQRKMALYLVNPDTQFILYRPVKNNIIGLFASLHAYISSHYSVEDLLIIGCPTSEQVSILLSSVSLVTKQSPIPES